jgi:hypothetical protein
MLRYELCPGPGLGPDHLPLENCLLSWRVRLGCGRLSEGWIPNQSFLGSKTVEGNILIVDG